MPRTNTHGFREEASRRKPTAPSAIPVTIVGSGGQSFTMRLTNTCSRMIVPALITVTCSASKVKVQGRPRPRSSEVTAVLTGARSTKSRRYHSTDPKFWK